jgi:hypothetical protein
MRGVSKKIPRLGYKRQRQYVGLAVLVLILGIGGVSSLFTAFGPSSGWEGDTELVAVQFEDDIYTDKQEILDLGGLTGARIVTADFDGSSYDNWDGDILTVYNYFNSPGLDVELYNEQDMGAAPDIRFSVGQLFYTNELGEKVDEEYYNWVAHQDDVLMGDVHYYFGFSVMFTTRAETQPRVSDIQYYMDDNSEYPYMKVDELPEGREVELESTVDLRIETLTDSLYVGKVESITLLDTVSRYTSDYGLGNDDLSYINNNLDWNSYPNQGVAQAASSTPIELIYDVINTDTDNVARIKANARMKPGFDWFDNGRVYLDDNVHEVSALQMYDVELMYHIVAEVTINNVPLMDWTGYFSAGTGDYSFRIDEPETEFPFWIILLVVVIAFVIL